MSTEFEPESESVFSPPKRQKKKGTVRPAGKGTPGVKRSYKNVIIAVVALTVLGIVGGAVGYLYYLLPKLDGELRHESLRGEVRIVRDDWGVPHIQASYETDAFFAFGFAIAQDRLFQMEILRRLASGRLAEILGPDALPSDKLMRTLMLRRKANELLMKEDEFDPTFLDALDAYLAGANFFIDSQKLPIEFTLLGFTPEHFARADSIALLGYMAYGFAEGIKSDSLYSILKQKNPGIDLAALFPGYSRQRPVTIAEGIGALPQNVETTRSQNPATRAQSLEGLEQLFPTLASAEEFLSPFRGSNSWVVAPSRSASGQAILANDPHIGFSNPAVWYEAHIKYEDYESYGLHLPLIPYPLIGFNSHKAWAMTMFENDDIDLYGETFHPDDPNKVMYNGEWVETEKWTETIQVKGREHPETIDLTTTPHGPIITNLLKGYEGRPVSLWWLYYQSDAASVEAMYRLSKANNYEEYTQAVSALVAPGLNISYADSQGNIAWWGAGRLPIRAPHVTGKEILDGASGRDEVLGYLPFEQNPHLLNPPAGVIVTANNQSTTKPVGPIQSLEGYWQPTDRAGRIETLLNTRDKWDVQSMMDMQNDNQSPSAPAFIERVISALERATSAGTPVKFNPQEQQAYDALRVWNFMNETDSVGATVYHIVYETVLGFAVGDELGDVNLATYRRLANSRNFLKHAVQNEALSLWDNIDTEDVETRDDILVKAFRAAVTEIRERCGDNPGDWSWGKVHTVEYEHLMGKQWPLNYLYNIGPYPSPGAGDVVNHMVGRPNQYRVNHGPSMRLIVDFADVSASRIILPTGNSGNFLSPHFRNQAKPYLAGAYRTVRLTDEQVAINTRHTLRLKPTG